MFSTVKGTIGIIQAIDPENYTASVKLREYEDRITKHLQILSPLTLENKISCIPKIGTPVICLFLGDDADNGFIIGAYYSKKNNCHEKENEFKINYQNSVLTIKEDGNIEVNASLTTIVSDINIIGDIKIKGKVESTEDMVAGGISLINHKTTGVKAGKDKSGPPE